MIVRKINMVLINRNHFTFDLAHQAFSLRLECTGRQIRLFVSETSSLKANTAFNSHSISFPFSTTARSSNHYKHFQVYKGTTEENQNSTTQVVPFFIYQRYHWRHCEFLNVTSSFRFRWFCSQNLFSKNKYSFSFDESFSRICFWHCELSLKKQTYGPSQLSKLLLVTFGMVKILALRSFVFTRGLISANCIKNFR